MKLVKKVSIPLVASIFLSACSSSIVPREEYDHSHSKAWNIVSAADMVTGINDTKLPKNNSSKGVYDAAFVLSGFYSGLNGVGNLSGGLYNLGWSIFEPSKHGARNTLIGWLPVEKAKTEEEARAVFLEEVTNAIKLSFDELNIKYEESYKDSSTKYLVVLDYKDWGCTEDSYCAFNAKIYEPDMAYTPPFLDPSGTGKSWAFRGNSGVYFNFLNLGKNLFAENPNTVDQVRLNALISKHLPDYAYIYIAPNKTKDSEGNKVKIPYLLEKGKPQLFIVPQ